MSTFDDIIALETATYEAQRRAWEEERSRLAKEAHDREWGHIVGKTVAAIDADFSGDGLVLTFTDGSRLTCDIEPGFYDSPSTLEITWRQR